MTPRIASEPELPCEEAAASLGLVMRHETGLCFLYRDTAVIWES